MQNGVLFERQTGRKKAQHGRKKCIVVGEMRWLEQ